MTKYLLYNSRLVRPEMEKPDENNYCEITGSGIRLFNRGMYSEANKEYTDHFSTLPGIECSEELLAKFKNGDELIEGKDFEMGEKEIEEDGRFCSIPVAVPVQSDEEDEINLHDFLEEYGNYVLIHDGWNAPADFLKDFPNYKLTKR